MTGKTTEARAGDGGSPALIVRRATHVLVSNYGWGMDRQGLKALENVLTLWNKDEATNRHWVIAKMYLKTKGTMRLPRNVPEQLLREAWPLHEILTEDPPGWPARRLGDGVRFRLDEYPERDGLQRRIIEYLGHGRGMAMVEASTASGKTYCALRSWIDSGVVLLGTFAQETHRQNFMEDMLKFTTVTKDDILVVTGLDVARKAVIDIIGHGRRPAAILVLHRTVSNSITAALAGDGAVMTTYARTDDVSNLIRAAGAGFHVSDECHLEMMSLMQLAMTTNVRQTVYLTATASPLRNDWKEDRLLRMQLPTDAALRVATENRLLVSMVRFDSRPSREDELRARNVKGYFDVPRYYDYLAEGGRAELTGEVLTWAVARAFGEGASRVGVVVSGKLEFLKWVIELFGKAFPERSIGNFSSLVSAKNRMEELNRDIIVTTDKSFAASVNPLGMSHLVMLAPVASSITVKQIAGRLRGIGALVCQLIDLWDSGFDSTIAQAKLRRATYAKLIAEPIVKEDYDGKARTD